MKIAFYIYTLSIGGAEKIATNYLKHLKAAGHEVVLIEDYDKDTFLKKELQEQNISVYTLSKIKPTQFVTKVVHKVDTLFFRKRINNIIKKCGIQIIHFHSCVYGMDRLTIDAKNLFFTFHADFDRNLTMLTRHELLSLRKMANSGMSFIALDSLQRKKISDFFSTEKCYIVPNGIDFVEMAEFREDRRKLLDEFNIDDRCFVVGHIGRFHKVKNHEKIIEVFKEIYAQNANAILILVGGDVDNRQDKIRQLCIEMGVNSRVYFWGIREDVSRVVQVFDLFIFPSHSECFPLSLLEVQYFGIPCLVSDNITKEIIVNQNCIALDIMLDSKEWANRAIDLKRQIPNDKLFKYDVRESVNKLIEIYSI